MADGLSTSPNKETVTLRLPSGEMVDAIVPAGYSDADLKSYVRMKQPALFGAPAGVPKPSTQMTSEEPIASGLTSMETQLSNLPRNLWQQSFFGEIGNPKVKALHEARDLAIQRATQQPGIMPGIKATAPLANPVVKTDAGTPAERTDIGATVANLLPYLLAARAAPTGELTSPVRAAVRGTNKVLQNYPKTAGAAIGGAAGAATHVPFAREIGAGLGAAVGSEVLPKVRIPGEGIGLPNRVTGGPAKAPQYVSPSKVSTTAPESPPAVSLNRLTSDIQSLGYSKADALARAKAGIAKYPNDLNAATTEAMRPSGAQSAAAPQTPPPPSKPTQVAQARATQTAPAETPAAPQPKVSTKVIITKADEANLGRLGYSPEQINAMKPERAQTILQNDIPSSSPSKSPQYEVAPPSRPLRVEGKDVPADTELTGPLQKSIPQNRIQGKIMQVVRREGTLGMDRLMQAPELQGLSREQVEKAATDLGNSKKLWVPTKEADAHGPAGIISLAIRKP